MNEIKSIGLFICLLVVLLAYLKQMIPEGKSTFLIKMIVSTYILLSLAIGFQRIDPDQLFSLIETESFQEQALWDQTEENVERELADTFQRFLEEQNEDAEVKNVDVDFEGEKCEIRRVLIVGPGAETAKSLLAGRFGIGMRYIEVENE